MCWFIVSQTHWIKPNRGRLYIGSPDWIKNKKTINTINKKDNKCFQYSVIVALSCKNWKKNPERITKIKPFIDKYDCEGINYPSEKDDQKKFEQNNLTVALNVLYAKKKKYILPTFQNITQIVKNKLFF